MATFGKTTDGASSTSFNTNRKVVSAATPTLSGTITSLSVRCSLSKAGSRAIRGVIYLDNGGVPGALYAYTNEGACTSISAQWYTLNFSGGQIKTITANQQYWIGFLLAGDNTSRVYSYRDGTAGLMAQNADTYSDGPSDPFGTYSTGAGPIDAYVTYSASTSATPTAAALAFAVLAATVITSTGASNKVFQDDENFVFQDGNNYAFLTPPLVGDNKIFQDGNNFVFQDGDNYIFHSDNQSVYTSAQAQSITLSAQEPTVTEGSGASVSSDAQVINLTAQDVTVTAASNASVETVRLGTSLTIPATSVSTESNIAYTPPPLTFTFAAQSPSVGYGTSTSTSENSFALSANEATATGAAAHSPDTEALTFSVPSPTVSVVSHVEVSASNNPMMYMVLGPTVNSGQNDEITAASVTITAPDATVTGTALVAPAAINVTLSAPEATVGTGSILNTYIYYEDAKLKFYVDGELILELSKDEIINHKSINSA